MKTECNGCIFFNGGVCEYHNRLAKFEQRNEVEHTDKGPVIDRVCTAVRDAKWGEYMSSHNVDKQGMIEHIDDLLGVQADILVDAYEASVEDTQDTIDSILAGAMLPKLIVVGICANQNGYQFMEMMERSVKGTGIRYVVMSIKPGETNSNKILTHMAFKAKAPYIAYFYAGDLVPESLLSELNRKINYDMNKLMMIRPFGAGLSGLVVNRAIHRAVRLDDEHSIVVKVEELVNINGHDYRDMIMEWTT